MGNGTVISVAKVIKKSLKGHILDSKEAILLADCGDLQMLSEASSAIRDEGHGDVLSFSPKVFVPFTRFCQEEWGYSNFANPHRGKDNVYLTADEILSIARAGAKVGCHEALFFLAAKPEQWSDVARDELVKLGYESTLSYLAAMALLVLTETGLLPKLHSGVINRYELRELRGASVAQGLMLDSRAEYMLEEGESHYDSPDQHPHVRLGVVAAAGAMAVPFTSGIVIGIGENRRERIDALLALREINDTYGHLQEVVIQDFRREQDHSHHSQAHSQAGGQDADRSSVVRIARAMLEELLWTVAVARIILGAQINIQAPADLPPKALALLVDAGINDWGSVSPANTYTSWPQLDAIARVTQSRRKRLKPRLPVYPPYIKGLDKWVDRRFHHAIKAKIDHHNYASESVLLAAQDSANLTASPHER